MNSFPENPEMVPETQSAAPEPVLGPGSESAPSPPHDPAWTGWDVLAILTVGVVAFFTIVFVLIRINPGATFQDRANKVAALPELAMGVQTVVYLLLLGCMYVVVAARTRAAGFWKTIHWNWPSSLWPYLLGGVTLQAVVLLMEQFLPLPKNTPFDSLFKRLDTVALIALFSVTLGPLMEELFFRGFLYPVLARRFGVMAGILATALGFALVHAPQYANSWVLVSLLFLVGVVLGAVRALKNSVAAGFLVHVAYNATIMGLALIATGGFRHLDKLSQ